MPERILAEADVQFYAHPPCPQCGVAMWLVRVSPTADREEQLNFECKACGEMTIVECRLR
jgi:predicted RNA-binding Zn-ribbon protein involved in translation (DUF1610 family)